jgi:hypothetical protein
MKKGPIVSGLSFILSRYNSPLFVVQKTSLSVTTYLIYNTFALLLLHQVHESFISRS